MTLNRQARFAGYVWKSYGPVTHAEAARLHCKSFNWFSCGEIETRCESCPDAVQRMIVSKNVEYRVRCLRGDADTFGPTK